MFKKRTIIFILLVILIFNLFNMVKAKSNEKITLNAKAVYVATTDGKILYEFNSNAQLPIASLTKIMTYLVSRELMHKHSISVNKTIYPKFPKMPYDAVIMGLNPKHKVKIGDLLNCMMSISANDAAEALRNYFTYLEKKDFIRLMNEKAKKLGMQKTYFINASGLTEKNKKCNKSTAKELYFLANTTISKYPEVLQYTKKQYIVFNNKKLPTTFKKLLDLGIDGLKTGYTKDAGYCIVATTKIKVENNQEKRVIIVILGEKTSDMRKLDLRRLLDFSRGAIKQIIAGKAVSE